MRLLYFRGCSHMKRSHITTLLASILAVAIDSDLI